ncbi:MAG: SRPBCC family protein [Actinophytocola sp.]|nr:SRPBCC family protein [Actinophytocola sp.]
MATLRTHTTIDRPATEVWDVVSDAGNISAWFPAVKTSTATDDARDCELADGSPLNEEIVTNDPELRRFQYRITGGMPVESHLGTVDVIDTGTNTLVVYSTEITPDSLADMLGPAIEEGVQGLKEYCEA